LPEAVIKVAKRTTHDQPGKLPEMRYSASTGVRAATSDIPAHTRSRGTLLRASIHLVVDGCAFHGAYSVNESVDRARQHLDNEASGWVKHQRH